MKKLLIIFIFLFSIYAKAEYQTYASCKIGNKVVGVLADRTVLKLGLNDVSLMVSDVIDGVTNPISESVNTKLNLLSVGVSDTYVVDVPGFLGLGTQLSDLDCSNALVLRETDSGEHYSTYFRALSYMLNETDPSSADMPNLVATGRIKTFWSDYICHSHTPRPSPGQCYEFRILNVIIPL